MQPTYQHDLAELCELRTRTGQCGSISVRYGSYLPLRSLEAGSAVGFPFRICCQRGCIPMVKRGFSFGCHHWDHGRHRHHGCPYPGRITLDRRP